MVSVYFYSIHSAYRPHGNCFFYLFCKINHKSSPTIIEPTARILFSSSFRFELGTIPPRLAWSSSIFNSYVVASPHLTVIKYVRFPRVVALGTISVLLNRIRCLIFLFCQVPSPLPCLALNTAVQLIGQPYHRLETNSPCQSGCTVLQRCYRRTLRR